MASFSVNKVTIMGRLGDDPKVTKTKDDRSIVNLSVATSESWKDKQTGEKKEVTEWHRVVIFNEGLARVAESYLKKGSQVYLEGQLKTRKWKDKDDVERYSTEVVLQGFKGELGLLGSKSERDGGGDDDRGEGRYGGSNAPAKSKPRQSSYSRDLDDSVPF